MKKIMLILVMIMTMAMGVIAQETKVESKKVYDESINTMTQIDDAIKTAKTEGKYVICQVGGNWCPWCIRFAKFIKELSEIDLKNAPEKVGAFSHFLQSSFAASPV